MKTTTAIIALIIFSFPLFAQEENMASNGKASFAEQYNYLIRAKEEKTRIWKLTPLTGSVGTGSHITIINLATYLGYEKKLTPSFSINGEVGYNSLHLLTKGGREWEAWLSLSAGPRYYYNIKRRINLGKSANNFSANYFSPVINLGRPYPASFHSYSLLYGIQRRVGNKYFVDFSAGLMAYRITEYRILTDIRFRFGWGW
ncbi:MAG: hypothetical protein H0X62_03055 [Bacteroidetes bacterium]|nr:hypothetical protein [Bacteroidota bacterium]